MAIALNAKMLPTVLSVIAGSVDAIGFLGLGGLFTAHVTGNLVVLVAHLAIGGPPPVANILSVPLFVAALGFPALLAGRAIVGFAIGCGLGGTCEAAIGLTFLALPVGLAVLAVAMVMNANTEKTRH